MNLTETHQIRPNHKLYSICDELCFKSKNLYNAALFEFRQSFFDKELDTLTWQNINRIFNQSNQFDYRELPSKVSNTVLKKLGNNLSSFWSLIKKSDYDKKVRLPKYLHKTDGRFIVEFNKQTFSNKRDEDAILMQSTGLLDKDSKEIFDGDILAIETKDGLVKVIVFWDNEHALFMVESKTYNEKVALAELIEDSSPITIIGNIHENSALLEK